MYTAVRIAYDSSPTDVTRFGDI